MEVPQKDEKGKIFIGGLSWDTTQETLLTYFSRYGEVVDCVVMKNKETGKSRGFGFVTYKDPSCVEIVLSSGPHIIDSRQVDPKACNPRTPFKSGGKASEAKSKKIFVGGLPYDVDESALTAHFSKYGKVADVAIMFDVQKGRSRGFGFLTFESEDSVDEVCKEHYVTINGKQVECKRAEPRDAKRGMGRRPPIQQQQQQSPLQSPSPQGRGDANWGGNWNMGQPGGTGSPNYQQNIGYSGYQPQGGYQQNAYPQGFNQPGFQPNSGGGYQQQWNQPPPAPGGWTPNQGPPPAPPSGGFGNQPQGDHGPGFNQWGGQSQQNPLPPQGQQPPPSGYSGYIQPPPGPVPPPSGSGGFGSTSQPSQNQQPTVPPAQSNYGIMQASGGQFVPTAPGNSGFTSNFNGQQVPSPVPPPDLFGQPQQQQQQQQTTQQSAQGYGAPPQIAGGASPAGEAVTPPAKQEYGGYNFGGGAYGYGGEASGNYSNSGAPAVGNYGGQGDVPQINYGAPPPASGFNQRSSSGSQGYHPYRR